jgi:uncharacterized membrane protein
VGGVDLGVGEGRRGGTIDGITGIFYFNLFFSFLICSQTNNQLNFLFLFLLISENYVTIFLFSQIFNVILLSFLYLYHNSIFLTNSSSYLVFNFYCTQNKIELNSHLIDDFI